jgi:hypothetical protein
LTRTKTKAPEDVPRSFCLCVYFLFPFNQSVVANFLLRLLAFFGWPQADNM